jgi:hypothetical protein
MGLDGLCFQPLAAGSLLLSSRRVGLGWQF